MCDSWGKARAYCPAMGNLRGVPHFSYEAMWGLCYGLAINVASS